MSDSMKYLNKLLKPNETVTLTKSQMLQETLDVKTPHCGNLPKAIYS